LTVEELRILITADSSKLKSEIEKAGKTLEKLKEQSGTKNIYDAVSDRLKQQSFLQELQLTERLNARKQNLQEASALNQRQLAERQSLILQQLEDRYDLRQQLSESIKMSLKDKNAQRHASIVEQLEERTALRQQQLDERVTDKKLKLNENVALQQQQLAEKNALKQQQLDEKNALRQQQLAEKNAQKQQNNVSSILNGIGGKIAGVFATLQIGKALVSNIKDSVNAVEYESLFQVSFGKMADGVRSWSNEVSQALGLNATEIRKTTAVMYDMIKALNVGEKSALTMAKGVTLLSKDVASFRHTDPQLVYDRISSGLMGNTRGLHLMGYAITEATVKNFAYQKGIAQVGSELTEQQKVVARYLLLIEQTKTAHGNLAQTLNSPANQIRMLTANLKYLSETIGNLFMPLLNAVLPILNAFAILLTRAVTAIREFFGFKSNVDYAKEMHEGLLNATTDLGDMNKGAEDFNKNLKKTDNAIKKVQKSLAKFDEMNVLMDKTKTPKTVIDKNALKMQNMGNTFDFPIEEYNAHLEWVKDNVKRMVDEIQNSFNNINFEPLKNSLKILQDALKPLTEEISQALQWLFNNVLMPISKWTIEEALPVSIDLLTASIQFLSTALDIAKPVFIWFYDNFLVPLSKLVGFAVIELIKLLTKVLTGLSDWANDNKDIVEFAFKSILSFLAGMWIYNKTKPINKFITDFTQAMKDGSGGVLTFSGACKTGLKGIQNWFETIGKGALATFALQAGMAIVAMTITDLMANWAQMNGLERTIGFIGATAAAILMLALAIGVFQSALTAGIAVAGIVAGVSAVYWSICQAQERAKAQFAQNMVLPPIKQPNFQMPKLAEGGIVKHRTFAEIGENGAEAIVPLEKNTGWIDMLASKLGGSNQPINLTVKIGEDSIINRVIDGINNKTMEMGRGMVMM